MKHILIIITILIGFSSRLFAQTTTKIDTTANFTVYFRFDKAVVDSGFMDNKMTLHAMDSLLYQKEVLQTLDSIVVVASASPEGVVEHNISLAMRRAKAMKGYIIWKHSDINQQLIRVKHVGENWNGLRNLVESDNNVPYKNEIIKTLNANINPATKEWRLKQVGKGIAWKYIENNYLKYLRSGASCVIFYRTTVEPQKEPEVIIPPEIEQPIEQKTAEVMVENGIDLATIEKVKKPLLAIKSNLLYDAITVLNIEVEVPIGQRWSIAAEYIFPWWSSNKANWTMQMLSGHAAVKYWLVDRSKRDVLTGWHIGLYGGLGKYDFQMFDKDGEQGDFFDVGIQAGYAHTINNSGSLRMEYSLGLGYMQTDYKSYDKVRDTKYGDIKVFRYPWEVRRRNWVGPINAKISLVWLLHYNTRKR